MSKKLKKLFQKVTEILQIRRIKNSKYFDTDYYYKNNADVKMAGIDEEKMNYIKKVLEEFILRVN